MSRAHRRRLLMLLLILGVVLVVVGLATRFVVATILGACLLVVWLVLLAAGAPLTVWLR